MTKTNDDVCLTFLVSCLILFMAGCSKPESVQSAITPPPATPAGNGSTKAIDACSLLTSKEIETIQGTAFKESKRSSNSQRGLTISQCYFLLPAADQSIVVTMTKRAAGENGRDPKQSWEEIFHGDKKTEGREEGEREAAPPEKVTGLGDEAFWVSQRFGGRLYVLKGDIYISVAVGSPGDPAAKIQKSKALAEMVLSKM